MDPDFDSNPIDKSLLPSWFTERMMNDVWNFGLLLDNGQIWPIQTITRIDQDAAGNIWLSVRLVSGQEASHHAKMWSWKDFWIHKCDRLECSIAARSVVAAFELADT